MNRYQEWAEANRNSFRKLTIKGDEWLCCAPYREDERPSLSMNVEDGLWNDFGIGRGGTFTELAQMMGVEPPQFDPCRQISYNEPSISSDAVSIWLESTSDGLSTHPYLVAKGIDAQGLNLRVDSAGWLVAPIYSSDSGKLQGVERVSPTMEEGEWPKLASGAKVGGLWVCGSKLNAGGPFVLCEGVSTAATVARLFPEYCCLACFGAGNIFAVANALYRKFPERKFIVASDNDEAGRAAYAKTSKIEGLEPIEDRPPIKVRGEYLPNGADWNDVARAYGDEEARRLFSAPIALPGVMSQLKQAAEGSGAPFDLESLIRTRGEMRDKVFPKRLWPVETLICPGLSILAGYPKAGKSSFITQAAAAVSNGDDVFGLKTNKMPVLYLAMEDGDDTFNDRMKLLEDVQGDAPKLEYVTAPVTLSYDGVATREIALWLLRNSPAWLIVDTWGMAQAESKSSANAYIQDVRQLRPIKLLADLTRSSITLLHHLKKGAKYEGDILELVSGSLGISGTADGILMLKSNRQTLKAKIERRLRRANDAEVYHLKMLMPFFARDKESESLAEELTANMQPLSCPTSREKVLEVINSHPETAWKIEDLQKALPDIPESTIRGALKSLAASGAVLRPSRGFYISSHAYDADTATLATPYEQLTLDEPDPAYNEPSDPSIFEPLDPADYAEPDEDGGYYL